MKLQLVAMLSLVGAGLTHAGGLYGSVTVDGQLPKRAMDIELACQGRATASFRVDERGSYRVIAPNAVSTPCEVRIEDASVRVVVYPNPTRYDFALTHSGGKARLTQR